MLSRLNWRACKTGNKVLKVKGECPGHFPTGVDYKIVCFFFLVKQNFENAVIFLSITHGKKSFFLFALVCKFFWCNGYATSFSLIMQHI
jgi:hypothetical protein